MSCLPGRGRRGGGLGLVARGPRSVFAPCGRCASGPALFAECNRWARGLRLHPKPRQCYVSLLGLLDGELTAAGPAGARRHGGGFPGPGHGVLHWQEA